jgi:hypothetical protein
MIVYLVGGICMGIMLRPWVDELIKSYVEKIDPIVNNFMKKVSQMF